MIQPGRILVLGAGLTGAGTALELAAHGLHVTLVDRDERPMNRAALRNEGKIHLGLLYANDRSLVSADLQLRGALAFRRLLAGWIGAAADRLRPSTPFWYLVAADSLLSPDQLASHYASVEDRYREYIEEDGRADYLGCRPPTLWSPADPRESASFFRAERLCAAFRTAELAIDTADLARSVREAIAASPNIRFRPGHHVRGVDRRHGLLYVEGSGPGGTWRFAADQVVNALWEQRIAIDSTAGMPLDTEWVHRLKYRVIARLPPRLRDAPSATLVIGRYGDVVVRADGTAYLSWYPAAMRGWTHDLLPPASWDDPCRGVVNTAERAAIARDILQAIDGWYPGIGESEILQVDAGAILARGRTDVDDPDSALHDRSRIGVVSLDGYHSVEPGKLTTAPIVAAQAAACVRAAAVSA
jgi:glycine/D-amino acid oxidase-like deaminating enzyme